LSCRVDSATRLDLSVSCGQFFSMQAHDISIHGPMTVHLWSSFEPKQADLCR
jgi:hypothetical protein